MPKLKHSAYRLLRKSESLFKTDMVYVTRGGFWLVGGQVLTLLMGFGLSIAFANMVPKETYGIYKFILSIVGVMGIVSLSGMAQAVVQAVARGFEGALREGFRVSFKWDLVAVPLAIAIAIYYYMHGNIVLSVAVLVGGLLSPVTASALLFGSYLEGKREFKTDTLYDLGRNIIPTLALLVTVFTTDDPLAISIVYFLSYALSALLFYYITLKKFKPSHETMPGTLHYSKHLSIMNVLSNATNYVDKILIFHYLGAVELALYSFAILIPEQIKGSFGILTTLAFPKLAKKNPHESRDSVYQKSLLLLIGVIMMMILYAILVPFFFQIFFPQYLDAIFYSQVAIITLLANISTLPGTALRAGGAITELHHVVTWSAVAHLLFLFFGIYYFGILGAILGGAAGKLFKVGLTFFFYDRYSAHTGSV